MFIARFTSECMQLILMLIAFDLLFSFDCSTFIDLVNVSSPERSPSPPPISPTTPTPSQSRFVSVAELDVVLKLVFKAALIYVYGCMWFFQPF